MKSLRLRLDDMTLEVTHILECFGQPGLIYGASAHGMVNLRVCVDSASRFVSTAISMVSTRLGDTDSRTSATPYDFSEKRRNDITFWVRKHAGSETVDDVQTAHESGSSVMTTNTFDREGANLQTLLKLSKEAYIAQKFDEAKQLLETFWHRCERKYGTDFEERNEVLALLGTIYCRQEEWESAEGIAHMDFEGQEGAMKSLVFSYWDHRKWDDALRLLSEILQSDRADEMDCEYVLAELYFVRGFYDKAIQTCDRLLRLLGTDHVLFYLILSLLADVYEAKGDAVESRLHRELLPPGIECNSPQISVSPVSPISVSPSPFPTSFTSFMSFEFLVPQFSQLPTSNSPLFSNPATL